MKNWAAILFFLLLSMVLCKPGFAMLMTDLYQATVPVPLNQQQNWQKAAPDALKQVLIKLTGHLDLASDPVIQPLLKNAVRWVQSYKFISISSNNNPNNSSSLLNVQIKFDPSAVKDILRQANQPLLGENRPLTLVWLAVQSGQGAQLVPNDPANNWISTLTQSANLRGVPLLWPAMDLTDVTDLKAQDVWSLNVAAIEKASSRYQTANILAGKIYQNAKGQWQSNWVFIQNGQSTQWQMQGNDANAVFSQLTANLVNTILVSNTSSPAQAGTTQVFLKIIGVNGLDDYGQVVKYMRSLGAVTRVDTNQVDADYLILTVSVTGGVDALIKEISLSQKLTPLNASNTGDNTPAQYFDLTHSSQDNRLVYEWHSVQSNRVESEPVATPPPASVDNNVSRTEQNDNDAQKTPDELSP